MDLDETSVAIGNLTAEVKNLNENYGRLIYFIKENTVRVEAALTKHSETDESNFKSLNEKVGDLSQFKTKVITIASICTFLCSCIVSLAVAAIRK